MPGEVEGALKTLDRRFATASAHWWAGAHGVFDFSTISHNTVEVLRLHLASCQILPLIRVGTALAP
jgi:hypothetical protein